MKFRKPMSRLMLIPFAFFTIIAAAQKTPQQLEEMKRKIQSDPLVSRVTVSPQTQSPSLIQLKPASSQSMDAQARLSAYLGAREGIDLLAREKQTFTPLAEVLEYQQYFRGIKVDRARYKAVIRNNAVLVYSGAWYNVPAGLDTRPVLTREAALAFAKARVNAVVYAEQELQQKINATSNPAVREELKKELAEASTKGELVIVKDFTKTGVAEMRLAYKFDIYASQPLSRAWVYVDAQDGRILLYDPIIKHAGTPSSVNTTVKTRYAGNRVIRTKQVSGTDPHNGSLLVSSHPTTEVYVPGSATWVLIDDTRGKGIETYDLNGVGGLPLSLPSLYIQGKSFTDTDNNWSLAEHKRSDPLQDGSGEGGALEAENDDIAWDAHWGASMVYDYWTTKQGRKSFDDRDGKIKSFIHYGPAYDNAFWNGSVMTYGDGSGTTSGFRALTSLDVCGHEIGHGVCSYTSDLVYEKESGAMNEALSDIWAACVERFAITAVDNTLASVYRPFYIGEQISASPDNPLRRMDNPKAIGDPDTYGGQYWRTPNCSPSLTNDYCGVHTNSGVLNKWFYLLTVGSHSGSGPDAMYARADSDDGLNDLGNSYQVTGVGFEISEKITYLMELMLSSTATYAEAREASIAAATVISGDACSPVVQSVTNAWYAVGVGTAYNPAGCVSTYGFVFQPGTSVHEDNGISGCDAGYEIKIRLLLPPNSTATVTASGTATAVSDYQLPVTSFSNSGSSNLVVEVPVIILNDAVIEQDETIQLSASISNTGSSPVNTNFSISIKEDDITPIIGNGTISLLTENFNGIANGYNLPTGWAISNQTAGNNNWGVWDGQLKITASVGGVQLPSGTYDNTSPTSTIAYSKLIDATGLNGLSIKFDYRVQGEVDVNGLNPENFGVFDYMAIVYSFDGVNFTELNLNQDGFGPFCAATPTTGTFEAKLPAFLGNRKFYIGFKWFNDTNAGGPESVSIDNLDLAALSKTIEDDVNQYGWATVFAGQEVQFYSEADGEVLGSLANNSTKNFGCTNMYVERTGNSAFNLYYGNDGLQKVSDKVFRIEPSSVYKVSTTLRFYYSEAQLAALEQATGKARTAFMIYHVNAASYSSAAQKNTRKYTAVYNAIPGVGGTFTVTISNAPIGSFALGCPTSTLAGKAPVASAEGNHEDVLIYPNPVTGMAFLRMEIPQSTAMKIDVYNSAGQLVITDKREVQKGISTLNLDLTGLSSGSYLVKATTADGRLVATRWLVKR
ncbi:MAG TPA: M4 family metallopeptidase [Chitinophagaceae bacterium]